MQFYSAQFLLFVFVIWALYYTVCRRFQWILLLIGSLTFYALLGKEYIGVVLGLSVVIWLASFIIGRMNLSFKEKKNKEGLSRDDKKKLKAAHTRSKRVLLIITIILAIGNLTLFKVLNIKNGLLLPIGISFYTFQALSYFFDVYMDKYEYERNYLRFLLFMTWFPQMIQGPISRYDSLGYQFRETHRFKFGDFKHACFLFSFGLLKKYAIADVIVKTVTASFENINEASGGTVLMGTLFSLVQLYCDFSGGIDMVLAISEFFGLKLKDNFNQPYFSSSLADFWHRWHITLGDWMRDYIFYPLAVTKPMLGLMKWGSKHFGKTGRIFPAIVGNLVIFTLVGIWHGTGWNYVIWGFYNGVVISIGELLKPAFQKMNQILHIRDGSAGLHVWRVIRTDFLVAVGELMVMVGDITYFPIAVSHIFTRPDWRLAEFHNILYANLLKGAGSYMKVTFLVIALVVLVIRSVIKENCKDMRAWIERRNAITQSAILCAVIFVFLSAYIYQNVGGGFLYANF